MKIERKDLIAVPVSREEKARIEREANSVGLTMSAFIRLVVNNYIAGRSRGSE